MSSSPQHKASRPKLRPKPLVWMPTPGSLGGPPATVLPPTQDYQNAWTGVSWPVGGGSTGQPDLGAGFPVMPYNRSPPVTPTYKSSPTSPSAQSAHSIRGASGRANRTRPSPMAPKALSEHSPHSPTRVGRRGPQAAPTPDLTVLSPHIGLGGVRVPIPLPQDVHPYMCFPVKMKAGPARGTDEGLRLSLCTKVPKDIPCPVIVDVVEGSSVCLDAEIRTGEAFVVHRAYFRCQNGPKTYLSTPWPPRGFTMAHLLTLLVRKQYDGWIREFKSIRTPTKIENVVGITSIVPPGTNVLFSDLVVVAIRRSDGKDGRVRWFPQLEVSFPNDRPF